MAQQQLPPVTSRTFDWRQMVITQWGEDWRKPEWVYEMSNGRKFDSTDYYTTGIYQRS
jgi:hypothetical protein